MPMTLYNVAANIRQLLDAADDDGGEISDDALSQFDQFGMVMDDKVDSICAIIAEIQGEIAARKAEIDRLRAGVASRESNVKRLKEYMRSALAMLGEKKHKTATWTVSRCVSPPSTTCTVADPEKLPAAFQRVKIEPNNQAALAEWRMTGVAPDGFVVTVGEHLRIA